MMPKDYGRLATLTGLVGHFRCDVSALSSERRRSCPLSGVKQAFLHARHEVRSWHPADILDEEINIRLRGQSGHPNARPLWPLLTQIGRPASTTRYISSDSARSGQPLLRHRGPALAHPSAPTVTHPDHHLPVALCCRHPDSQELRAD